MSADRLRYFIDWIRRLRAARSDITHEIRDVFAQAKSEGFAPGTMRQLLARMDMEPHQRAEADGMLESYEAALGLAPGDPEPSLVEQRPDAAALALELLTAEIVAIEDPGQAAALVEHVLFLLDLRAEIAVLRAQESGRKALAKLEGWDAKQIGVTVRWFEKIAKHGEEAMRAGEATFQLYRGTVEGHQAQAGMASDRDKALFEKFAGGAAPDKAAKKATRADQARATAIALAELARRAREG